MLLLGLPTEHYYYCIDPSLHMHIHPVVTDMLTYRLLTDDVFRPRHNMHAMYTQNGVRSAGKTSVLCTSRQRDSDGVCQMECQWMTRPHRILPIPDPGPQSILVTIIDASAASPSSIHRIPLSLSLFSNPLALCRTLWLGQNGRDWALVERIFSLAGLDRGLGRDH